MRIDYCPKCKKAGLKYENGKGEDSSGKTQPERYEAYRKDPEGYSQTTLYGSKKWCPRCQEWVIPYNQPYIGIKGIG